MQFPRYEVVVPLHGFIPSQPWPRPEPRPRPVRPKRRSRLTRPRRSAPEPRLDIQQYLELEFIVDERR